MLASCAVARVCPAVGTLVGAGSVVQNTIMSIGVIVACLINL
jgi:hypothetical protein